MNRHPIIPCRTRAAILTSLALLTTSVMRLDAQIVPPPTKTTSETIKVSGMLMTNFMNPTNTLGTATGDLRGAVAATLLEFNPTTGRGLVQHEWVTEAGDRLLFAPMAFLAAPAAADPALGLFHVYYPPSDAVIGGTGKFEGATGKFTSTGSADFVQGQTVFRYSGTITLKAPVSPALSRAEIRGDQFRFQVQAPTASRVTAEASANLTDWEPLGTKENVGGSVEFSDPSIATQPKRFYRARSE